MGKSDINRKFERMFPGIKEDEDRHYKTTFAEGPLAADRERQHRQDEVYQTLKKEENDEWYICLGRVRYDFKNKTETFIPASTKTEEKTNKDNLDGGSC